MNPETTINEMDDSYANGGYQSMSVELPPVPSITTPDGVGVDPAIVMGSPDTGALDPKNVTVYANSINPVSYMGDSTIVAFDVVFSVGCVCPESGRTETYQVVKRIGVDKMKLANDAKSSTPVSIVEAKVPAAPEKFLISKERMRTIAGLK